MGLKFNKWEPNKTIVRAASFGCLRTAWHAGKGEPTHESPPTSSGVHAQSCCNAVLAHQLMQAADPFVVEFLQLAQLRRAPRVAGSAEGASNGSWF